MEQARKLSSKVKRKSQDYSGVIQDVYDQKFKSGEISAQASSMDKDMLLKKLTERSHSSDTDSETSSQREERIAKLDKELLEG